MKFEISVTDFQYAMRLVRDVVPNSGPNAESVGVLISAQEGRATFTAFNPEMVAKATVIVKCSDPGEAVVSAAALHSSISHFQPENAAGVGTSPIRVSTTSKTKKLVVSATTTYVGGSKTPHRRVFPLCNHEFFPDIPEIDPADATLELPAEALMDGVDSVSYAASADRGQLVFTGISLTIDAGKLTMVATDGICLAEYNATVDYHGEPIKLVVPSSFAIKLSKSYFDGDTLSIVTTPSMIFVRTPNLTLGGTLIKEAYPDYRSILTTPDKTATIDKHVFLDNLLNLGYEASSTEDNRVTISLQDGEASLRCNSSENGGIVTSFKETFKVDCNLKLLAQSTKNLIGDEVTLSFDGPMSPLHIYSLESMPAGGKLSCVLVPLTPKA